MDQKRLESNQTQHGINFINSFLFRIINLLIPMTALKGRRQESTSIQDRFSTFQQIKPLIAAYTSAYKRYVRAKKDKPKAIKVSGAQDETGR
jgi:hypothetical protein